MSAKTEYLKIREAYRTASDSEKRALMDRLFELIDKHPELRGIIEKDSTNLVSRIQGSEIREKLSTVEGALNFSYVAKHYLGKSRSWFSQRYNSIAVNGYVCSFSRSDVDALRGALLTLSEEIKQAAESL